MQLWHIWIVLGILFFIIEIFTPSFFFASLGVGAFVASISAFYGLSVTTQVVMLSLGTFVVFIGIRPILKKLQSSRADNRKIGVDALIGQKGLVLDTIDTMNHTGRIKLKGEDWKAASFDDAVIKEGAHVIVLKIEGATAFVKEVASS